MALLLDRLSTPIRPGTLLQSLNPRWGSRLGATATGTIASLRSVGTDAVAVRIRPPLGWKGHRAGQFVTLGVEIEGVRHHRCFTLTSPATAPSDLASRRGSTIEVTVQAQPDGVVSRHLVDQAMVGDKVVVDGPHGDWIDTGLAAAAATPDAGLPGGGVLLVSAGSGVTPTVSLLRTLAGLPDWPAERDDPDDLDVVVIHHTRGEQHVLHGGELARIEADNDWLRVELVPTRTESGEAIPGSHLDATELDRLCPDWRERRAHVCGPEAVREFALDHWDAEGLSHRLSVESFGPAAGTAVPSPTERVAVDPEATGPFAATFLASDSCVPAEADDTLLTVAEDIGLSPSSGCRMGICHTCSTPLRSGVARDLRTGRLVEAGGHVQICVSAAATDVELDL